MTQNHPSHVTLLAEKESAASFHIERTPAADALSVRGHVSAGDAGPVHTDAGQFFDIVDGGQYGHVRIPLAAAWAAYLAEFLQGT